MIDILKFLRSCLFCKKTDNLKRVYRYGIYGGPSGKYFYYHDECLEDVLCNPFKAGHNQTDQALQITDLIEEQKNSKQSKIEEFQRKCKKAKLKAVEMDLLNNKRKYQHISK